jgi:hypothetical protein
MLFLSLIFCKQEEKLLFFESISGCTCLILFQKEKGEGGVIINHRYAILSQDTQK